MSAPRMTAQTVLKRYQGLVSSRAGFDAHWKELSRYMLPRRGRFTGDTADSRKKHQALVNNTPLISARNLAAGMMSGLTSPARPWFDLALADPALSGGREVKSWLETVTLIMREAIARSNLYNSLAVAYLELGVFGTAAIGIYDDPEEGLRAQAFTAGEYVLAGNGRGVADTVMRETCLSAGELAARFGLERIGPNVRAAFERGDVDALFPVLHAVTPNPARVPGAGDAYGRPYLSRYLLLAGDAEGFLSEGGFEELPVLAPRWSLCASEVYGGSPGMDALGDSIALQTLEKKRAQALEKLINPPMVADPSLRNQPATVLPGGVTYAAGSGPRPAFTPAYQIAPPLGEVRREIEAHEDRIRRAFYEDLFLMIAASQGRMTAREVEERHEEKLLMLGPVLERLEDELLDPLIDRVWGLLNRAGRLPPPPPGIAGEDMKIEYISILARAQKASALYAMNAFTGFVANAAALSPSVVDCVDFDRLVERNADAVGVSPTVVRDRKEVKEVRASRAAKSLEGPR